MTIAQGDSDLPLAFTKDRLKLLQNVKIANDFTGYTVWPLFIQRLGQAAEIAGRFMHVGFANLNQTEPDDGVHVDLTVIGSLADKLVMHLAFRRHVDHHIGYKL